MSVLYISEGAADWSEEHQRLFVMQYMTIDVWDIVDCVKVQKTSPNKIGPGSCLTIKGILEPSYLLR